MEFTLLFAALIGAAGLWLMLRWEAARGNAADCARDLWDVGLTAAAAGLLVGRLAAMINDGVNPILHPGDIVIVRAGVATGWASLAAIATAAWLGRRQLWIVADGLSAAALAGLGGWHAGCLAREACLGTPTGMPWGVAQTAGGVTRHPVEIYAALLLVGAGLVLAWWKAQRRPPAAVPAGLALAAAGAARLATEPFRPTLGGGPVWWYVAAVTAGIAVAAWGVAARRRANATAPASS